MLVRVYVTIKSEIDDPQSLTKTEEAKSQGFGLVKNIRQGKYFELTLKRTSRARAQKKGEKIAKQLLANPVYESYRVEVVLQQRKRRLRKAA